VKRKKPEEESVHSHQITGLLLWEGEKYERSCREFCHVLKEIPSMCGNVVSFKKAEKITPISRKPGGQLFVFFTSFP